MKKILLSLIIIAASLNAMATDYAVATLTLKGNTSLEQGEVTLAKTDDPAASSFCAPLYIDQYHVVMYALNGSEKYQIWANADLTNLPLGFKTYSDENYTITVSNVSGSETLILRDLSNNEEYSLVNNAVIEFSAAANSTIEDRFVINYQAPAPVYVAEVTTNADGLATFSFDQDLVAVESAAKLYKGQVVGDELVLAPVDYVKAGEGVIVYNEAKEATTYHFNLGTGTSTFENNDLKAASTWAYPHANSNAYVLSGSALYLYEEENMKPNKAFLLLPVSGAGAPKRIAFRFDQATGIESIAAEGKAVKFVENGRVFIKRGEKIYNVQGQLVK